MVRHFPCKACGLGICAVCMPVYKFQVASYLHFRMWQRPSYRALGPRPRESYKHNPAWAPSMHDERFFPHAAEKK